mmetsp:Transcript_24133/g.59654  ORF Transcript_24133/g.59654 Transcript_24133/m.59654 type:complete len:269 (-) Transcript_24133:2871-3677(-)
MCLGPVEGRWYPRLDGLSKFIDDLIGRLAGAACRYSWLDRDDDVKEVARLLLLAGDVCIHVQAKDVRFLIHRQSVNVIADGLQVALWRCVIYVTFRQLIAVVHYVRTEVSRQDRINQPDILVVGDSAAIVDLRHDVIERLVRHTRLLSQIHVELLQGDLEVAVHPLIGDVPTNGAKLAPFEDHRVEEGEGEEELLELPALDAALVHILRYVQEAASQVGLQTLWRLICDLDSALQHWHGERGCGHGCQPETVVGVNVVLVLLLLNALE